VGVQVIGMVGSESPLSRKAGAGESENLVLPIRVYVRFVEKTKTSRMRKIIFKPKSLNTASLLKKCRQLIS
jgi:hypothetical protein